MGESDKHIIDKKTPLPYKTKQKKNTQKNENVLSPDNQSRVLLRLGEPTYKLHVLSRGSLDALQCMFGGECDEGVALYCSIYMYEE